ncbi:MAG TPA: MerC domain-containing protein [Telluria sp.]|nr:MerC domain-containing protein [Telluria sp.]
MKKIIRFADCVGMGASALCLVHCLAMPLLLLVFPLSGLMGKDDSFHRYLAAIVTLPVLLALVPGFIAHRRWAVLVFGATGLPA